jgi:fatty acid desaturase
MSMTFGIPSLGRPDWLQGRPQTTGGAMSTTESKRPSWMKEVITTGGEFHAMKQAPWRHNLINLGAFTGVILCLGGLVALAPAMHWAIYLPVSAILMGCLFFGLFILVIHECSHNMFLLTANRELQKKLNRWIGVVTSAFFFTDYLRHWEKGHTIHHLRPCEADDPQDADPLTGRAYYIEMAKLIFIPGWTMKVNPSNRYGFNPVRLLAGLGTMGLTMAVLAWLVHWQVAAGIFLAFGVLSMLNLTKKAQEHGAGLAQEPDFLLRSRTYLYPLAPLTSPFCINYHFEHHANFNVPWYLLPAYHQRLRQIVPEPLQPYIFHHDYLEQLAGKKLRIPAELRHLTVA